MRVFVLSWILLAFVTPAQGAYSLEKLDRLWFPGVIDEGDTLGGSDVWGYIGPDSTDYAIMGIRDGIVVCEVVEDGDSAYLREVQQVAGPTEDDYYYHRDIKTFGDYAYVVAEAKKAMGGRIGPPLTLPVQGGGRIPAWPEFHQCRERRTSWFAARLHGFGLIPRRFRGH